MAVRGTTGTALAKAVGGVVAVLGVIGFAGVRSGVVDVSRGVWDNPLPTAAVVLGVALGLFGLRHSIANALGLMTPKIAYSKIRSWLDSQTWTVTPIKTDPDDFRLRVVDRHGNGPYLVALSLEPREVVVVVGRTRLAEELVQRLQALSEGELLSIWARIMAMTVPSTIIESVTLGLHGGAGEPEVIELIGVVPLDDLTISSFFDALSVVGKSLAAALLMIDAGVASAG